MFNRDEFVAGRLPARLPYDFRPPYWSTNQDRRIHHTDRTEMKVQWREGARIAYRAAVNRKMLPRNLHEHGLIVVTLEVPVNDGRAMRDPINYCGTVLKACIDGLILGSMAPDDNPLWVTHREPTLVTDKARKLVPVIELTIEPRV